MNILTELEEKTKINMENNKKIQIIKNGQSEITVDFENIESYSKNLILQLPPKKRQ